MRKILIFTLSLFSFTANCQDLMAVAFYEKAQRAFENEDFEKAIEHLNKSKEVFGDTNPDILYLEAKSKFEIYTNINEPKQLMQDFLYMVEGDQGEETRAKEIANILADIETSDNYYSNGQIVQLFKTCGDGYMCMREYNKAGEIQRIIWKKLPNDWEIKKGYYNKFNIGIPFISQFSSIGMVEEKYCNGNIFYRLKTGNKYYLENLYYENEILLQRRIIEKLSPQNVLRLKYCDKKFFVPKSDVNTDFVKVYNPIGKKFIFYYNKEGFTSYKNYDSDSDNTTFFNYIGKYEIIQFHTTQFELLKLYGNEIGIPKKVKFVKKQYSNSKEDYEIIVFDLNGIPIKKETYKKSKLKSNELYNREKMTWMKE
nr:hypothetical protein [uncultured Psychroserpens sp.]